MMLSVLFLPRTLPVLADRASCSSASSTSGSRSPRGSSQRITGGVGVMIDDLIAGAYALVLVVAARAVVGVPA